MSEMKTSQMISKDADPINLIKEDERTFDSDQLMRTEGAANLLFGRKPGGVVNGSVKKAETGPMYMSDYQQC